MGGSVAGVILAGGSSKRMGSDKSFLELGGKTVIERVIEAVSSILECVMIITNEPERYARFGLPTKPDVIPGIGTLGGIHAGLFYLEGNAAFFAASDMPFITPEVIELMVSARRDADAVVPYIRGEYEPLLAVYGKSCLGAVEKKIAARKRRAISFLADVTARIVGEDELRKVDPELISFFNINTPADYERAKRIVREKGL